jgi:hypothetical protein
MNVSQFSPGAGLIADYFNWLSRRCVLPTKPAPHLEHLEAGGKPLGCACRGTANGRIVTTGSLCNGLHHALGKECRRGYRAGL